MRSPSKRACAGTQWRSVPARKKPLSGSPARRAQAAGHVAEAQLELAAADLVAQQARAGGRRGTQAEFMQRQRGQALASVRLLRGWMSFASPTSIAVAMPVWGRARAAAWLSRSSTQLPAPGRVLGRRQPGGQSHEQEGQIEVTELAAPVLDQALEAPGIGGRTPGVLLALIPEHAAHRQAVQRRDQAVVAQGRRVVGDRAGRCRELAHPDDTVELARRTSAWAVAAINVSSRGRGSSSLWLGV